MVFLLVILCLPLAHGRNLPTCCDASGGGPESFRLGWEGRSVFLKVIVNCFFLGHNDDATVEGQDRKSVV